MVKVMLDKERRIRYRWPAVKRLKKDYGINLLKLGTEQGPDLDDPEVFELVLWAGLLDEEPGLEREQISPFIGFDNLKALLDSMSAALLEGVEPDPTIPSSG